LQLIFVVRSKHLLVKKLLNLTKTSVPCLIGVRSVIVKNVAVQCPAAATSDPRAKMILKR
jgi:hypothetical protein